MSSSFFSLQGKALKEINAIPRETLDCFLPGRAKDLSAPLYITKANTELLYVFDNKISYEVAGLALKDIYKIL